MAVVLAVSVCASAMELVTPPEEHVVATAGEELRLHCESAEPYTFCTWETPGGDQCSITAGNIEDTCVGNSRVFWEQEGNSCGILIDGATRALDDGEYTCKLGVVNDEADFASATKTVDVMVPADVHFNEEVTGEEVLAVVEGEGVIIRCHATGGYPLPNVTASLGDEESPIDEDLEDLLEKVPESGYELAENEDGTADVTQAYHYVPHRSDCGKYLKCAAQQVDPETGDVVLSFEDSLTTQKIMVQFPPTPLDPQLEQSVVVFAPGDENASITITFEANPTPEDNQAIWHIDPHDFTDAEDEYANGDTDYSGDSNNTAYDDAESDYYDEYEPEGDMHDVVVVQAGETHSSARYEAAPLNITDHTATAVLVIRNLVQEDMDHDYSLVVRTDVGEMTYKVQLVSHEDNSVTASPDDDGRDNPTTVEPGATASASTGTIVAIVLVVLLVFFALGFVFWAKRYNKCCFHQHQVVVVKKDGGGGGEDVEVATRLTDQMDNGNKMTSVAGEDEKPESDKKLDSGN